MQMLREHLSCSACLHCCSPAWSLYGPSTLAAPSIRSVKYVRLVAYANHYLCSCTQVETGSAITWKYPSVILKGDDSVGEFYSVALTNNMQQADTGTKMVHIGKNTRSRIVSKGISAGHSQNCYRGLVQVSHPVQLDIWLREESSPQHLHAGLPCLPRSTA